MNITEARRQLLSLPEKLAPGESLEVIRHQKIILKIVRPPAKGDNTALAILDRALASLPEPRRKPESGKPPRSLAVHYKKYLYAKKN